jgi:predicted dehydrogenase
VPVPEPNAVTGAPVGVAVVGAGYWGPNLMRNFANSPSTELVHVCDLDPDRAKRVLGTRSHVRVSADLESVLDNPEVEAVAVATPPASHLPIALSCLDAGRHVLMEKPLATSVADGITLVEAAERADRVLMCDHTYCFTPAVQTMRRYVEEGRIGEIQYAESIRVNLGIVQSDVDVFWDLAPHDLSIFDFVLPSSCRPSAVAAYGADPIGAGRCCIGYLTLPLLNGGIAHITVSWISPAKIRQMILSGATRMVLWDDMRPYQRLSVFDRGVDVQADDESGRHDLMVNYRRGDMMSPALPETVEALEFVVAEFASAIREQRAPLTDGWSGVRVLEVLEAAAKSRGSEGALVPLESPAGR